MKYDIQFTNQFKKDLKLAKKQNKNLDKLFEVIDILANGGTLEALQALVRTQNYSKNRFKKQNSNSESIYQKW